MNWFNHSLDAFSFALLSILFEGLPFLLLGSLISGVVDVFVSSDKVAKILPKNPVSSVLIAGLLGLIFPICECGSVVVVRRFLRKGLPLSSAISYMLAAPIVSPIVALSTFKAFTGQDPWLAVTLRLGMGYLVSVSIALILQRIPQHAILQPGLLVSEPKKRRTGFSIANSAPESTNLNTLGAPLSFRKKVLHSIQSATADFLDVALFFFIGACLAALFIGFKETALLPLIQSPILSIMALMGLASLLCLCSTTDAFVAANAFGQFSLAAKIGFLVFGAMFDLKLFWLYGLIFKRRVVIILGIVLFAMIAFLCWQLHRVDFALGKLPGISSL